MPGRAQDLRCFGLDVDDPDADVLRQVAAPDVVVGGVGARADTLSEGLGLLGGGEMLMIEKQERWEGGLDICGRGLHICGDDEVLYVFCMSKPQP
jgi:hypothetical protein